MRISKKVLITEWWKYTVKLFYCVVYIHNMKDVMDAYAKQCAVCGKRTWIKEKL